MNVDLFNKTYIPLHETFYRVAYRYLENQEEAKDVVQEIYLKLWENRESLKSIKNAEAYGVTLTKNRCLDILKSARVQANKKSAENYFDKIATFTAPKIEESEKITLLRKIVDRLPERQKGIFYLRYFRDLSIKEIATLTSLNEVNIRVQLVRAKKIVKEQFEKGEIYER